MNSQEINLVLADLSRNGIMFYEPKNWFGFCDHFVNYNVYDGTASPDGMWQDINDAGTGANTLNDTHGGTLSIVTSADNDDYHFLSSRSECVKFQANKEVIAEAIIKLTEASTSAANWIFGLSSVNDATLMGAAGAGPPAEYDGAVFFKVDGTMYIQTETSNATTQVTSATALAFVSATEYRLRLHFIPSSATAAIVNFEINGTRVASHAITITGLEEMHFVFGVKAGTTAAETLIVDSVMLKAQR